ncbi:hypothetical protein ACH61_02175 [Rathayibacter tanaceti]|uniref:Uncharacterized protein n=1 Tax=Rathayibacter tanaceti TaxID=1671680 RepID=A0A162J178_9MICO|nr:hypothetical protein ACH61_02175 [Rathayibacter tanaceti]
MTNPHPDAPRAGAQRTLALVLLVVVTALALLLGHPLERLHDALPATSVSASTGTAADAPVASASVPGVEDSATLGGLAELCAMLAAVCLVVVAAVALAARARPGQGAIASTAPPAKALHAVPPAARVRPSHAASCVPLRL